MQSPDSKRTMRLEGPLTVAGADALKIRLVEAIRDATSLEVDVSGATDIDVSALQILIAARKMADAKGKTMIVPRDDRLQRELDRFGIPVSAISHDTAPL